VQAGAGMLKTDGGWRGLLRFLDQPMFTKNGKLPHSPLVNLAGVLYHPQQENDLEVCHVGSKNKAQSEL
jgi:hypothetical protein